MDLNDFVKLVFDKQILPGERRPSRNKQERLQIMATDRSILSENMINTFENSGDLLTHYTNDQISQGLEFINYWSPIKWLSMDPEHVPEDTYLRAFQSYVTLFQQVMTLRCPSVITYGSGKYDNLAGTCYMWWENTYMSGEPDNPARLNFDLAALKTMEEILALRHLGCQESALHGINHWTYSYPAQAQAIVDRFLSSSADLSASVRDYAQRARAGGMN